ncbi:hypothetical protein O3S68_22215 [Kosakonia sp. SOY2]|uniref:hypothetical protein n=1 Tax=Kosakonia sp. SOY2 TaxID=3014557 RepID=UPI0022AC73D1|nr:hypothetical protein [Kosakonia sp. SOY2]MCZ3384991.1 hypothetical protein [Kosakonia sp. SOY2]
MNNKVILPSVLFLITTLLVGCGDKQPDCGSSSFSKLVLDLVGGNAFSYYKSHSDDYGIDAIKFSDKDDYIQRNHIELRNIRESSSNEKNQQKTCNFDISIQPAGPITNRLELKNQTAVVSIDNEGKEVISAASNLGYSILNDAESVERGHPSKEQQEALDTLKKKEAEQQKKTQQLKNEVLMTPAEGYHFISEKDLTWLFISRAKNLTQKEMLNLTNAQYYNEQDDFKKRDIEKTAIPAMMEKVEQYKNIKFIKFITAQGQTEISQATISGDPVLDMFLPGSFPEKYDFDKNVFPLTFAGCPQQNSGGYTYTSRQNISINWDAETSLSSCMLKPKDEGEARSWNEIFQQEKDEMRHNNYVVHYFALNDELDSSGRLQAMLVRSEVNYNGAHPLKLTTE